MSNRFTSQVSAALSNQASQVVAATTGGGDTVNQVTEKAKKGLKNTNMMMMIALVLFAVMIIYLLTKSKKIESSLSDLQKKSKNSLREADVEGIVGHILKQTEPIREANQIKIAAQVCDASIEKLLQFLQQKGVVHFHSPEIPQSDKIEIVVEKKPTPTPHTAVVTTTNESNEETPNDGIYDSDSDQKVKVLLPAATTSSTEETKTECTLASPCPVPSTTAPTTVAPTTAPAVVPPVAPTAPSSEVNFANLLKN